LPAPSSHEARAAFRRSNSSWLPCRALRASTIRA